MRRLIDYGIDIVLGSHPHVVQGIEVYRNGLIAYSLGNCIFDQSWSRETSTGMILDIGFAGEKPLYFRPRLITIEHAQAHLNDSNAGMVHYSEAGHTNTVAMYGEKKK